MKLYYELKEEQKRLVQSDSSEELWYCVPLDLLYNRKDKVAEEKVKALIEVKVTPDDIKPVQ